MKKKKVSHNKGLMLLVLPSVIIIFVMKYLAYPGLYLAFVDYLPIPGHGFFYSLIHAEFVGLDNFQFILMSPDLWEIMRNTIGYNLIFITVGLVCAVTFAILLNEIYFKRTQTIIQTAMFFPFFMSWVAISLMMQSFLDPEMGLFNRIIEFFGGTPVDWYLDPTFWPFIIIFMGIWKNIGYNTVIYLSSIVSIDDTFYEAALIDGASKWMQIKRITLPSLKPLMITLTILGCGTIMFSDFGLFYHLPKNSGALYPATQTIDVFVYNALKQPGTLGLSAAASFFQSVVGCIMIISVNFIVRKIDKESALL